MKAGYIFGYILAFLVQLSKFFYRFFETGRFLPDTSSFLPEKEQKIMPRRFFTDVALKYVVWGIKALADVDLLGVAEHGGLVLLIPVVVQLAIDADGGFAVFKIEARIFSAQLLGGVVHHDVKELAAGELKRVLHLMHIHVLFPRFLNLSMVAAPGAALKITSTIIYYKTRG